MKYTVNVKEINYGSVIVEATNRDEAIEKMEDIYFNGNVYWGSADLEVESVEAVKERDEAR